MIIILKKISFKENIIWKKLPSEWVFCVQWNRSWKAAVLPGWPSLRTGLLTMSCSPCTTAKERWWTQCGFNSSTNSWIATMTHWPSNSNAPVCPILADILPSWLVGILTSCPRVWWMRSPSVRNCLPEGQSFWKRSPTVNCDTFWTTNDFKANSMPKCWSTKKSISTIFDR